uniref:Zinc finger, CCHC-type n=1 Tax=Tanacetum cinerariifolium TaxID=118510 RepID=A0A6L2JY10_TANCI|nr:zinc finger, CCHC-type [Tanacetum cinerariifolium]
MFDEDMVDHIAKVLELLDLIKIPRVDSHRLRMNVFPLSLAADARQWWINKGDGKITTWKELMEKFFCKFYLESHDGEDEMLDKMDNWRIDPLEFISRVNSSFKNHIRVDGRTKKVLFHAWMNGSWNKIPIKGIVPCNNKWEESNYGNPPNASTYSFFEPYLKPHEQNYTEKRGELIQMKRKDNKINDEKPYKRIYQSLEYGRYSVSKVLDTAYRWFLRDGGKNPTVKQVRRRAKTIGYLGSKYMPEDASSKKFLVRNFTNYKMTDSRPVLEQYNELLEILGRFTQHKMNMDESIQDSDKPKGNNVDGPLVVNMVEHNNSFGYNDNKGKQKHHDTKDDPNKKPKVTCWKYGKPRHLKRDCKGGNVGNKANVSGTKGLRDGFSNPLKGQNMFNKSLQIYYVTYVSEVYFLQDDDVSWWVDSGATMHVCKDRCWFKTYESLNDGSILHMGNKSTALVHGRGCVDLRLGHVYFKRMQDMSKDSDLCDLHATLSLGNKKYYVTFIDDASRKNKVLKEMVKSMLSYSRLSQGFWGKAMLTACYLLNRVPNKRNMITPYELKTKKKPNLNYLRVWGCKVDVRLPDLKLKTLVDINSIIESRDVIFDEHRFSSVRRLSQRSLKDRTEDSSGLVVSERVTEEVVQQPEFELRKDKRHRTPKDFGPKFPLYLIEGTRDEIFDQHSYCFNVEDDLKTFDEAIKSQDTSSLQMDFQKKLKVHGTIKKFKARLVIQGFKQKSGINYFDTYALVARISTIRLLIAMTSIHNLIIHQIDVKTAFLNRELEEEVYINKPLGYVMSGNENKVCKLIKSLYGLKQAPKQWHQKFDEVVLSNSYLLNQANKCIYSKIDGSSKEVIICQYIDDMLIFGTDQVWVDLTKKFLSSRFSMKDMGEADVIFGIRIKHESNVSTPLDTYEKLMPNKGLAVFNLSILGVYDVSWISSTKDNSSTSGWVFLLGGGTISWASKKQTCITGSTMEFEFVALVAAGKEAKWLKNLLLEIPMWVKPMAPISIRCDSAATLAKAYSQMYNGMFRHLGVRHSMIRELITNGVVSIEFLRSQQNLVDHLTKGLARDLVIKSAEEIGLKGLKHMFYKSSQGCAWNLLKGDEVSNFPMVDFFGKLLSMSMNKEKLPMRYQVSSKTDKVLENVSGKTISGVHSWILRYKISYIPVIKDDDLAWRRIIA